jgi:hypothetical protein
MESDKGEGEKSVRKPLYARTEIASFNVYVEVWKSPTELLYFRWSGVDVGSTLRALEAGMVAEFAQRTPFPVQRTHPPILKRTVYALSDTKGRAVIPTKSKDVYLYPDYLVCDVQDGGGWQVVPANKGLCFLFWYSRS